MINAVGLLVVIIIAGPCPRWYEVVGGREINTGDRVSCDGVVGPRAGLSKLVQCVEVDLPMCERVRRRDADLARSTESVLTEHLRTANKRGDEHAAEAARLRRVMAEMSSGPEWYEHPALWASAGLVVGVVVTLAVVVATR